MRAVNGCRSVANSLAGRYKGHMIRMDGKLVAEKRRGPLMERIRQFEGKMARAPGLAVILVGDDPASQVYVRNKVASCKAVGIHSVEHRLAASVTETEVSDLIAKLNHDEAIDGILLQLPLPRTLNGERLIECIDPAKDPDGLTMSNMGRLFAGKPRAVSCTPLGVMKILEHYAISVAGCEAVVVGRSQIVGKPMAQLLLQADATVTVCHSRTADLPAHTRAADLVIVAAGRPEFLGKNAFKKGAVVVDVGIHRRPGVEGKGSLCGDVKASEVEGWLSALTPVPGGVGPMTIAMLLENTVSLAEMRSGA
jgi:methylenetetrahydrofolate dehydrogenase (NADP+) / methenyltetrahydrofolate cyclohydrolase